MRIELQYLDFQRNWRRAELHGREVRAVCGPLALSCPLRIVWSGAATPADRASAFERVDRLRRELDAAGYRDVALQRLED